MTSAIICMQRDLKGFSSDDCNEYIVYAELQNDNSYTIEVCLIGPKSTLYQDNIFVVNIQCTKDYPFSPPTVSFITKIVHPSVRPNGQLITSFLQQKWTPTNTIKDILNHILELLRHSDIKSNEWDFPTINFCKTVFEKIACAFGIRNAFTQRPFGQ